MRNTNIDYHGWYKFKNISGADLVLHIPLSNGRNIIPKNAIFEADSRCLNIPELKLLESIELNNKKLLTEIPVGTLEIITEPQIPIKNDVPKGMVDISKEELIEFAKLKGKNINPNWTKTKILNEIRKE